MTLLLVMNLGFAWGAVAAPVYVADPCNTFTVPVDATFAVPAADDSFSVAADDHTFVVPECDE